MTRPSAEEVEEAIKCFKDDDSPLLGLWGTRVMGRILAAECEFLQAEVSRKDKKIERMREALLEIIADKALKAEGEGKDL